MDLNTIKIEVPDFANDIGGNGMPNFGLLPGDDAQVQPDVPNLSKPPSFN